MASPIYPVTALDADQVLQHVYDEPNQRLRVSAEFSGSGEIAIEVDAEDGDNVAVQGHANKYIVLDDTDKLVAALSTSSFVEIFSVTSSAENRIREIKVKADTLGVFRVKKNTVIQDYFLTSPVERNCRFNFIEDLEFTSGDTLSIEFCADRLRLSTYNFFMRIEGFEIV